MNNKRISEALISLGLSKINAQIYIQLATKGPQKAEEIAHALRIGDCLLDESLKVLTDKKIVVLIFQGSNIFFALPFAQVLEILLSDQFEEAKTIEQSKEEILANWESMIQNSPTT